MLVRWEQGDEEVRALWKKMNDWVYQGFDETYKAMGVGFDKIYYESETYLEGKAKVEEGLAKGLFFRKPDGSVWADLSNEGLDQKLLLRMAHIMSRSQSQNPRTIPFITMETSVAPVVPKSLKLTQVSVLNAWTRLASKVG